MWKSGYAIEVHLFRLSGSIDPDPQVVAAAGTPRLPEVTYADLDEYTHGTTVGSSLRGSSWRVVVLPIQDRDSSEVIGWVTVAQPLAAVQETVGKAALLQWSAAAAILVIGVIVGAWAVRRSLRPLREIETVAATIAAGDLSGRVPEAPTSTEVGRLGAALNGMLSQIETAFDARTASEERMRRFVADASHELRTPLAAIRGYGELYRMGALTEKEQVDDTMRRIEQSATEPVDLAVLATDAAHDLRALDPTRAVQVGPLPGSASGLDPEEDGEEDGGELDGAVVDGGEGRDVHHVERPTVVHGDEARLRQVVANLIGNVVRHTPAGSPVEIGVGRRGDRVVLEVRDHGPGIAPEHAARVFERFYRVDPSRTRDGSGTGGGAGLGMAIVAAIVEAHGGEVALVTTEGGGATVRVTLPTGGTAPADGAGDHPTA
jgi:two-component system OmpR family sensor kinase